MFFQAAPLFGRGEILGGEYMAIYVTGDTHGQHDFVKLKFFAKRNPQLTKGDYVIIAGDFGAVWSEPTLEQDQFM